MKIKIKPLSENFKMPIKGDPESACYDCYAVSKEWDARHNVWSYGLGFAVEPPKGYSIELHPRSSIYKTGLILCNSTGVVDNQYRGEVKVKFYESDSFIYDEYNIGDRVCQMRLVKDYQEELMLVDELSDTERGTGGFGSTGNK